MSSSRTVEYFRVYNSLPHRKEYLRMWRKRKRDSINSRHREKYKQNREPILNGVRQYRAEHPDKVREYNRRSYQKHAEARRSYARQYRENHLEHIAEKNLAYANAQYKRDPEFRRKKQLRWSQWRQKNIEYDRERNRKWYKSHPEYSIRKSQARRCVSLGTGCNLKSIAAFISDTKSRSFAVCYYCKRRVSTKRIHFDHIVPLSKGGPHSVENLCVSCARCNLSKSAKLLKDFVALGQQLLEL